MQRSFLLVLAWTTSTLLAVGIAAAAVGSVRGQVTDVPSVPVQATATSLAGAATPAEAPGTPTAVSLDERETPSIDAPAPDSEPNDTVTAEDGEDDVATTTTVAAADPGTDQPPATVTTTTLADDDDDDDDAATTSTTTAATTTTSTTVVAGPVRHTYDLIGGTVTVDVGSGTVILVGASPASGFSVEVENAGPQKVVVKFESENHESEFVGRFENGSFVPRLEESDHSGHDGDRSGDSGG